MWGDISSCPLYLSCESGCSIFYEKGLLTITISAKHDLESGIVLQNQSLQNLNSNMKAAA